ncbi:hypothetical protein [Dictyobacter kobayashii]|nr:hypothetical protein [Dictyobacter kobayashii]
MTSNVAFAHPIGQQHDSNIIVQTNTQTIPNATAADIAVVCPFGRIAIGGGGAIGTGGIQGGAITTTGPFPATMLNNPTGWHVIVTNLSGVALPGTAWVLCVPRS